MSLWWRRVSHVPFWRHSVFVRGRFVPVGGFRDVRRIYSGGFISMLSEEDLLGTIKDDISVRHGVRWFPPVWKMIAHFLQHGVLMSEVDFGNTTKKYFGDITLEEAYAISKRHVSIQVSVGSGHGFVLNHVTSPRALVRTAVCASCALPGLMRPSPILCKASDAAWNRFILRAFPRSTEPSLKTFRPRA